MSKNGVRDVFEAMAAPRDVYDDSQDEIRVDSSFAEESDINFIVERYARSGLIPGKYDAARAQYGDFSQIPDFFTMKNKVLAAERMFYELPAKLRDRFANSPGAFIDSINAGDPETVQLLVDTGLATARVAEEVPAPSEPSSSSSTGKPGRAGGSKPASKPVASESPGQE